jgi:adenylosuccinate synthase
MSLLNNAKKCFCTTIKLEEMLMSKVTVLVGGQWGSEGKGKLANVIADDYNVHVRTGAPNAGHTIYYNGDKVVMQTIPCGWTRMDAKLIIGAGGMIIPELFFKEIEMLKKYDKNIEKRIFIHPNVVIIEPKHTLAEYGQAEPCDYAHKPMECKAWQDIRQGLPEIIDPCTKCDKLSGNDLWKMVGSTREGCGAALADKIWRGASPRGPVMLAKEWPGIKEFCCDTTEMINQLIDNGESVLLEGTQGSGLSLHHGTYPKTTSRDTNAGGWISEAGISPLVVTDIIAAIRPYPIRVAGDSGPTGSQELTWSEIERRAGVPEGSLKEITTVTKRVRRVFEFSHEWFKKTAQINRFTGVGLCFSDYLNKNDFGVNEWDKLSKETKDWVAAFEEEYNIPINWISTGPYKEQTVIREIFE